MKALLLKEYYANQSTYAVTLLLFAFLALVAADNQQISSQVLIFLLGAYLWSTSYVDDQNKSHTLFNSLPINRRMVITSKYINGLLIGMLLLLLTIVINAFIPVYTPLAEMNIALGAASIMVVIALYYPAYIILGARFMGYVLVVAMFGLLAISSTIVQSNVFDIVTTFLQQQSTVALITGMTAASIVILILSWMLSVRVYVAKQF